MDNELTPGPFGRESRAAGQAIASKRWAESADWSRQVEGDHRAPGTRRKSARAVRGRCCSADRIACPDIVIPLMC